VVRWKAKMLFVPYSSTAWMHVAHAGQDRETTDHHQHADHDAEDGERAQAVGAEVVERHPQRVEGDAGAWGGHQLRVRATTGSSFAARDAG
jgi:hypothetical protein